MKKYNLVLSVCNKTNIYRTIIKTRHARLIYLEVNQEHGQFVVQKCFYIDRNQGKKGDARYAAVPKKLIRRVFPEEQLLDVVADSLDRRYYGLEYIQNPLTMQLSMDEYIQHWREEREKKYKFLILVSGSEQMEGDLPCILKTKLKTKLHRSVYLELHFRDGRGIVKACRYMDRPYKRSGLVVTPFSLFDCYFPYTREGILKLVNEQLICDFNHILVTTENDLKLSGTQAICGAL